MENKKNQIISIISIILLVSFLVIFLKLYGPEKVINTIGINNSYLILFLFAIFGGVSAFTAVSFYTTLGAFYLGGLNFFIILLIGTIGITIGDLFFYYIGKSSHNIIRKTSYSKKTTYLKEKMKKIPNKFMFIFIILYAGITIFPKDILCVALGITNYPFFKSVIPLFIGNLLFNFLFLWLISIGFNFNMF